MKGLTKENTEKFKTCPVDKRCRYSLWDSILGYTLIVLFLSSCSSLLESPKYSFSEGIYKARIEGQRVGKKVYVDILSDSLVLYPTILTEGKVILDTVQRIVLAIPEEKEQVQRKPYVFSKHSFDLDVLTFPLQFRPSVGDIPPQFNPSLPGAVYLGFRGDDFRINYKETPLQDYKKSSNHFGHSFGIFAGLGPAAVDESVTNGRVTYGYDGVALVSGGAILVGVNNFTVGLAVGFDHLLDKNRVHWIYQKKPWVGISLGLGLN